MGLRESFDVPILIVCRDRLTPLRELVQWLEAAGHQEIVMIDNDSTYEPLLGYYESTLHRVIRLAENAGPYKSIWDNKSVAELTDKRPFVVTDSDVVPDEMCPFDGVDYLGWVLQRFPGYVKAGFGLRIDDLPTWYELSENVRDWESNYWLRPIRRGLYHAKIDTTFALYRAGSAFSYGPAIRTGAPYVARHAPWYSNSAQPSAEELHFRSRCRRDIAHWDVGRLHDAAPEKLSAYDRLKWAAHARFKVRQAHGVPRDFGGWGPT